MLIGRDHPATVLRAEIVRATASHGGLVLVTGEAGIGKTTLVTRVVEEAQQTGALVLSGACWDSGSAPGYWPWTQVLRAMRRAATPDELAGAEEAAGTGLAVLLGEAPAGEAVEGFPLYDAVTSALVAVSQHRPVVVVLDDLHWADTASLKLLEFAAQHTWFERLLLVGTYRDAEVELAEHPLRPLLLPLVARATTVSLTGLDRAGVGALMAETVGHRPDDELVAEVHRRTGGNPFFVEQTARLWHTGGALTAIAPGVRDALRRRLSLLPEPVTEVLTTAAVLGREFHRQVLAATAAAPVPHVDRLLDQAIAARLVVTLSAGRFAFAHDLVRETLYDELDDVERRRRHAAVVRALDRSPPLAAEVVPAEFAGHAYLAGNELPADRVVDLLIAATRDAGSRMASEEGVIHLRRAHERAGPRRRVVIALDLGSDLLRHGNDAEASRLLHEAASAARELGDPPLLARAALTLYRVGGPLVDPTLVNELLVEVHRALIGEEPSAAPDRLVPDLALRIIEAARRTGDDDALGFALWARHDAIIGLRGAPERVALTDELMALARRIGDAGMEYFAASFRWVALLEQGDPGYLDQYQAFLKLTEREGRPRSAFASIVDTSIIATLAGRFDEAETALDRMAESFGDHGHPHFGYIASHLRWALWLHQGRFDELSGEQDPLAGVRHPQADLLAALVALQAGKPASAADALVAAEYPMEFEPLHLRLQAQAAAHAGDPEACERARAALAPFHGQWLVALFGCDIGGPVDLWLARLDAAQGRWSSAIDGLTAARRSAERMRARPWVVEAGASLAETLLASGDAPAASRLLDEVATEAATLGMRGVLARLHRLRTGGRGAAAERGVHGGPGVDGGLGVGGGRRVADEHPPAAAHEFRRQGAVWSLRFDGRAVHMPDAKGLRDLHALLSQPGTDIPAVRLRGPEGGEIVAAAARMGADPILDDEAKARYKRRLGQLDEQIDRAAELGHDDRAVALDRERRALIDELRAAAGLGGRSRRLGDEAEKARKTVTARIRDVLRRLEEIHPALAAHLRDTVSTGATCRYQPDRPIPWHL